MANKANDNTFYDKDGALCPTKFYKFNNETFYTVDENDVYKHRFTLDGTYQMREQKNNHPQLLEELDHFCEHAGLYFCKCIYQVGNVLLKTNSPHTEKCIQLLIYATHERGLPSFVDTSVHCREHDYTEIIGQYKNKLFILYGRYVYGHYTPYVQLINENIIPLNRFIPTELNSQTISPLNKLHINKNNDNYDNDNDDDKNFIIPMMCDDIIRLPDVNRVRLENFFPSADLYTYSWAIVDKTTNTLEAFSLYH
jgi:hypothetical protein